MQSQVVAHLRPPPGPGSRVHDPGDQGVRSGFIKTGSSASVSVRHTVGSGDYFQRILETSKGGFGECVSETFPWSFMLHGGPSPSASSASLLAQLDKQRPSSMNSTLLWKIVILGSTDDHFSHWENSLKCFFFLAQWDNPYTAVLETVVNLAIFSSIINA